MLEAHHRKQFFIAAGFSKPHVPLTVPKRYFDLYNPNDIELPPRDLDLEARLPEPALRPNFDIFIRRTARDEDEVRRAKLAYYSQYFFCGRTGRQDPGCGRPAWSVGKYSGGSVQRPRISPGRAWDVVQDDAF